MKFKKKNAVSIKNNKTRKHAKLTKKTVSFFYDVIDK